MDVLHRAGEPFEDLLPRLQVETGLGRTVTFVTTSGSCLVFEAAAGALTRRRSNPHSPHAWDGLPVLFEPPFFATSCGCGDRSGYRSTPLLLVATSDDTAEVGPIFDEALVTARRLHAEGHDFAAVPAGHRQEPCGALLCGRITPELASSG